MTHHQVADYFPASGPMTLADEPMTYQEALLLRHRINFQDTLDYIDVIIRHKRIVLAVRGGYYHRINFQPTLDMIKHDSPLQSK